LIHHRQFAKFSPSHLNLRLEPLDGAVTAQAERTAQLQCEATLRRCSTSARETHLADLIQPMTRHPRAQPGEASVPVVAALS
jgi:hypothetical protein